MKEKKILKRKNIKCVLLDGLRAAEVDADSGSC